MSFAAFGTEAYAANGINVLGSQQSIGGGVNAINVGGTQSSTGGGGLLNGLNLINVLGSQSGN